jgi:hypothetical protein
MANLSELFPSGGGATSVDLVASGAITAGDPVALNIDGTVSTVSGQYNCVINPGSEETWYGSAAITAKSYKAVYDETNHKVVLVFSITGSLKVVIGERTGNSITWGTPVEVYAATAAVTSVVYNPTLDHYVVSYYRATGLFACVVTVSGTTPTVNAEQTITTTSGITEVNSCYHPIEDRLVFCYTNASKQYLIAASTLGTTITSGTEQEIYAATQKCPIIYVPEFDIILTHAVGSLIGYALSDTTFTIRSVGGILPAHARGYIYDPIIPAVIGYYSQSNQSKGIVFPIEAGAFNATNSGNRISIFGDNAEQQEFGVAYDPLTPMIVTAENRTASCAVTQCVQETNIYQSAGADPFFYPKWNFCSSNTEVIFESSNTTSSPPIILWAGKRGTFVVIWKDPLDTFGKSLVVNGVGVQGNAPDYIGIAQSTVADTETVTVKLPGSIDENQAGLVPGNTYYIAADGQFTPNKTSIAPKGENRDPRVTYKEVKTLPKIGKALTSTSILLEASE